MPDIRIRRDHELGLPKARKIAWQWAEKVEEKFDMECTVVEGETSGLQLVHEPDPWRGIFVTRGGGYDEPGLDASVCGS